MHLLLKSYNKAGKATMRIDTLEKDGFDANYFTHFWKNKNNKVNKKILSSSMLPRALQE